jgi:hypothetical protein
MIGVLLDLCMWTIRTRSRSRTSLSPFAEAERRKKKISAKMSTFGRLFRVTT